MMELTVMFIEGFVCLMLLVLVEHALMRHWFAPAEKIEEPAAKEGSPDVMAERNYVNKVLERHDLSKPTLLALDLKKSYDRVVALRGVSFHVDPGETLAVLGMLGSGKSTLLDVLSGIQPPSGGVAYIGDVSHRDVARWEKCTGLCPDYDTFLGRLTVRQTLTLYAFIRGVQHQSRATLVEHLFALLNLADVADDTIDNCRVPPGAKPASVRGLQLKPEAYNNPAAWKAIDGAVRSALPAATFSGQLTAFVEYEVQKLPPWRDLARILTDMKHHLGEYVFDILMSEMTLEHVILKIAKYQVASVKGPAVSS
ncbi:hypothetical protein V5799_017833 [Amblyomma americanum]|uniref:ABC transporter domain-containing protein n=1 Tax=Amblyomma americanum TaxID=6943 RepID=A0AAQ4F118_AMBAM